MRQIPDPHRRIVAVDALLANGELAPVRRKGETPDHGTKPGWLRRRSDDHMSTRDRRIGPHRERRVIGGKWFIDLPCLGNPVAENALANVRVWGEHGSLLLEPGSLDRFGRLER